jgi:hypothetical protein
MAMVDTSRARRRLDASPYADSTNAIFTELCSAIFTQLPRSDQRRKAVRYLRGLLGAQGRKTVRNIAAAQGVHATEQNLHHFISDSTWDWVPVRQALARHLARIAPPHAWVVHPMTIPKAGAGSVGVGRRFSAAHGQSFNGQQAVGVWGASDAMSSPFNWRLHLSGPWLDDGPRRSRASIPEEAALETLVDCAVGTYAEMAAGWDVPVRPVVLDARELDPMPIFRTLRATGAPVLARVTAGLRLIAADPALRGYGAEVRSAHHLLGAATGRRRPVAQTRDGPVVTTVRVRAPVPVGGSRRATGSEGLILLGTGGAGGHWPAELWLTDLTDAQPATVLRLSRLVQRVDRDFAEIADRVGIRDFVGRSFTGWHRHVTLASAAHAVVALTDAFGETT